MKSDLGYPVIPAHSSNWGGMTNQSRLWVVVHCTADDYSDNYPTNLGNYWKNNRDIDVSVQYGISDTQVRQYVPHFGYAYQTRDPGNARGVGIEFSGLSTYSRATWLKHDDMLRNGAKLIAQICKKHGIPPVRLSQSSLKSYAKGIITHNEHRMAFGGSHTDPGPSFPMDVLMKYVAEQFSDTKAPAANKPSPPVIWKADGMALIKDNDDAVYLVGPGYKQHITKAQIVDMRKVYGPEVKVSNTDNFNVPTDDRIGAIQANVSLLVDLVKGLINGK